MKWLKKVVMIAVVIIMLSGYSWAEEKSEKPPLKAGRIAGEFLAGGLGGGAGLAGMMGLAAILGPEVRMQTDNLIPFILVGYFLICPFSVYLVGNIGNETGSFWATLGGSVLGAIVGGYSVRVILGALGAWDDENIWKTGLAGLTTILGQSIGATIAFNLTRKYKRPPVSEAELSPPYLSPIYLDLLKARF